MRYPKANRLRFLRWNEMDPSFNFFCKGKEKIALCAYEKWKFASLKVGLMTLTQMTPFFLKMKIQNLLSLSGKPTLACKTTSFPLFRFFLWEMKWIWEPKKLFSRLRTVARCDNCIKNENPRFEWVWCTWKCLNLNCTTLECTKLSRENIWHQFYRQWW